MSVWNAFSCVGAALLLLLAWLAGGCRRPIDGRILRGSLLTIGGLAAVIFWIPPVRRVFLTLNDLVLDVLGSANRGAEFLLGPLAAAPGSRTATGDPSIGFVLATQVLPAVVFFASLMALAEHLGLIQRLVRLFARIFRRFLGLSGAEALVAASSLFFGVEAATIVRPFLLRMTRSELMVVLTCGMSTVASTTLAIYVLFLQGTFPQIAGHLISASVLSIPAGVLAAKLMLPETATPETLGAVPPLATAERAENAIAALGAGAWNGLRLAAGIGTMLIAILGVAGLVDVALVRLSDPFAETLGGPIDLNRLFGWVFAPFAVALGIPPADAGAAGELLGSRLILTEVPAYQELAAWSERGTLAPRTLVILSYALCGFTHVGSLGIFVGGLSALAPERRGDLAALGPRALLAATLATMFTGAIAGIFYVGQTSVL